MVEGYFPFFGPLIISLRLVYVKAVSTSCWQTVSTSEVITVHMSSVHNYSVVLKNQLINIMSGWHVHGKQYAYIRLYHLLCVITLYGCVYIQIWTVLV